MNQCIPLHFQFSCGLVLANVRRRQQRQLVSFENKHMQWNQQLISTGVCSCKWEIPVARIQPAACTFPQLWQKINAVDGRQPYKTVNGRLCDPPNRRTTFFVTITTPQMVSLERSSIIFQFESKLRVNKILRLFSIKSQITERLALWFCCCGHSLDVNDY